jgi:hypothetical protein
MLHITYDKRRRVAGSSLTRSSTETSDDCVVHAESEKQILVCVTLRCYNLLLPGHCGAGIDTIDYLGAGTNWDPAVCY